MQKNMSISGGKSCGTLKICKESKKDSMKHKHYCHRGKLPNLKCVLKKAAWNEKY